MSKAKSAPSVPMRIILLDPPPGVQFAVQRGRSELLEPAVEQRGAIQFALSLRLGSPLPDGTVNFVGEFAQGTPSDRFVYINSGTLAGQPHSPWTRRAKLKLASIPQQVVEAGLSAGGGIMEARIRGTMGDGGPICASVKPDAVVWSLVRDVA